MKKQIALFFTLSFLTATVFAQKAKHQISPRISARINEMIVATIIELSPLSRLFFQKITNSMQPIH